jgi:ATP-dependent DNA ligase
VRPWLHEFHADRILDAPHDCCLGNFFLLILLQAETVWERGAANRRYAGARRRHVDDHAINGGRRPARIRPSLNARRFASQKPPIVLPNHFKKVGHVRVTTKVPQGPLWIHEVKQDGYRMIARRGEAIRLLTRNGFDWTKRYSRIVAGLEALQVKSATIDGEAVWLGQDGIADFRVLRSRTDDSEVSFYAFDLLELDGKDIRNEPLDRRRALLY